MEYKNMMFRIMFTVVLIAFLSKACSYLNKKVGLDDDNLIEEVIEFKILEYTGMNIDLTPESKE